MAKELGSTGLIEYSGQIQEDFLREWRGIEAYKRANEMRLNSPIVSSLLSAIEQSVRRVSWQLTSEEGEEDPRVELWEASCKALEGGWSNFIIESLSFLPFGFVLFETVWAPMDGQVILSKLAPRKQDTVYRWLFDDTGKLLGFVQSAAPKYIPTEIPIEKLLHLKTRSENGNPEGRSILRTAWVPYYYSKNISQIEAIGIERDLAGLPVITLPPGADVNESDTNSDARKAAKIVRNIRQDEQAGIVLPEGWTLALLSTGGSRQFDTDKIITRYNTQIMMTSLAQFLMLGQNSVGSWALSKDQSDLFVMSVNATCDIIQEALSGQVLPRLMALNGYDTEGLELTHTPAGDADLSTMADTIVKLANIGMITPLPADEVYVRKMLDMPEVDEETLMEERDRKEAQASAIAGAISQAPQEKPAQKKQVDEEDMTENPETEENAAVAQYFSSTRPDDMKRRRYYRKYQRELSSIFGKLEKRIKKEMRNA